MRSQPTTLLCRYGYDPLDRLTRHTLVNTLERQRFYCTSRLATEIQGATRYSIFQHGDQLLAQQQSEGNALDTTLLATDQQRSVLQVVKTNHPRQPIAYSPYGCRPGENGLLSLLGFNGERPDPVTGCYLLGNGYRAFNPVLMRFNSPDSWSPFGKGGLNSYTYCLGDPINLCDPQGHTAFALAIKTEHLPGYILRAIKNKAWAKLNTRAPRSQRLRDKAFRKLTESTKDEFVPKLKESALSEMRLKASGHITPFNPPETPGLSREKYNNHKAEGIPFDEFGIPNPKQAIITTNNHQEILRTDFFDDAIGHFHHQASRPAPQGYKSRMKKNAGSAYIERSEYIQRYASEYDQASRSSSLTTHEETKRVRE
ncbi:RHS repeat-associated core domain-containing protein [Pseudomonas sp. Leaf48]|uniref:RHS repeat-associated core domain-containing protein n=1 Tax=Pseudomonas sp. Leaf48 TaxID=1736221 RepID=UPI0009EAB762|nr:RHS repeat-associated core domain-containing protein [Pseudomonas sp. Leaf48]